MDNLLFDKDAYDVSCMFADNRTDGRYLSIIPYVRRGRTVSYFLRKFDDVTISALPILLPTDNTFEFVDATRDILQCFMLSRFYVTEVDFPQYCSLEVTQLAWEEDKRFFIYYCFVDVDSSPSFLDFFKYYLGESAEVSDYAYYNTQALHMVYQRARNAEYHMLVEHESFLVDRHSSRAQFMYHIYCCDNFFEIDEGDNDKCYFKFHCSNFGPAYEMLIYNKRLFNMLTFVQSLFESETFRNLITTDMFGIFSQTPIGFFESFKL